MGLISEYVEIKLGGRNIKHYENLGYEIPRVKNKYGKIIVPKGTTINVKVEDLLNGCGIKVKAKCDNPNCNKEYYIDYKNYINHNHNGKTYCRGCVNKVLHSGNDNYRWNPNLTDEERDNKRKSPKYVEFVKKVLKRDNYTCQCCEKESHGDMEVHHLDGYDWCKDKRTDETNGITLCKNCHKNFHSIYGYGNNTKEQYEEWIGKTIDKLEKYDGELPTTRKIYCIEEDKVYDSAEQLASHLKLKDKSCIYDVCNKISYSTKNKHLLWYDDYINMSKEDIKNYVELCKLKIKSKKVYQYDKNLNLIHIWNSIRECERNGFSRKIVSDCCNNKREIYENYIWKFENGAWIESIPKK